MKAIKKLDGLYHPAKEKGILWNTRCKTRKVATIRKFLAIIGLIVAALGKLCGYGRWTARVATN